MEGDSRYTRRWVLGAAGSAAVGGLAGCGGTQTLGDPTDSESTATPSDDHHEETDHGHDENGTDGDGHGHDENGSDGGGHGHGEGVGDPTDAAEVSMVTTDDGNHFEPHVVRVTVGGTVTFVDESGSHSATAYHPDNDQPRLVPEGAESWDSGLLSEEGTTFEHTFETEGVYHYYCRPHETRGMIGSVIVGEPDAHGQPALESVPEDKPERVREKLSELNETCNQALGHTH